MEIKVKDMANCARCGLHHANLVLEEFTMPIYDEAGRVLFTHWAMCPNINEPIVAIVIHEQVSTNIKQ